LKAFEVEYKLAHLQCIALYNKNAVKAPVEGF